MKLITGLVILHAEKYVHSLTVADDRVSHGSQEEFAVRLYRRENQVSVRRTRLMSERVLQSLLRRARELRTWNVANARHASQSEYDERDDLATVCLEPRRG